MTLGDFSKRDFERNHRLEYQNYIQDISSMKMLAQNLLAKGCRSPYLKEKKNKNQTTDTRWNKISRIFL